MESYKDAKEIKYNKKLAFLELTNIAKLP